MSIPNVVADLNAERYARGLDIPKPPRGYSPTADLSFMTEGDYWAVEPTGSIRNDFKRGRELADEFLAYIGEYPCDRYAFLLSSIVKSMIEKVAAGQEFGGMQTAFLNRINRYAMATAAIMELSQ
jgi:hypothetical protein